MTLTCRFINVFVTMNVHAQLKAVEKEAAGPKSIYIFQKYLCLYKFFWFVFEKKWKIPRMRLGNISPIISQGIGPNPIEKLTTYTTKAIRGIQPGVVPEAISYTNKEIVFCSDNCLKLCQNKKSQLFVGMLIFWILFLKLNLLSAAKKKGLKKRASQQMFGPSYFVRALVSEIFFSNYQALSSNLKSFFPITRSIYFKNCFDLSRSK